MSHSNLSGPSHFFAAYVKHTMVRKGSHKGARKAATRAERRDRELLYKDVEGQSYAVVTVMLGNGRLQARCEDSQIRLCKIRGSMRRSEWISVGDVILVGLREFQEDKADVLHRYLHEDVRTLRRLGELVNLKLTEDDAEEMANDEDEIVFDDDENDLSFIDAL